ncbi:MAG: amidophosphoribosyltransferase [Ignavibacteria bacterium]
MYDDKPKCSCGIFGIINFKNPAVITYYGLHALQHRGQEAAGIVAADSDNNGKSIFHIHKGIGEVSDVFKDHSLFETHLKGYAAIGHNRYSTTGSSDKRKNIQPFIVNYRMGHIAIAHNGNLSNAKSIRKELINQGAIFQTTTDTEVILHLIARSRLENQKDQIVEAMRKVEGAFSIVIMTDDKLIGARDKRGFKPLCLGKINGAYIITSETCALDLNRAEYIRDIDPGELVIIHKDTNEIESYMIGEEEKNKHCIFEFIYFSRPDSKIFGSNVDKIRRKLGKVLAQNHPVIDKDGEKVIVISVPDSSNTAAIGYQSQLEKMKISSKLEIGLIRNHYVGRTFILPGQEARQSGVRLKFNTVKGVLEGKTVVVIDDSIVRGNTSKNLVKLIREAKPKELHLRISSSPIISPCYYGMDFPRKSELVANINDNDISKIEEYLEVDSLEYMTIDEMKEAMVDHAPDQFCDACFSGNYPTEIDFSITKEEYDE